MSLVKCPECFAEISEHAESCPHCGYPISIKNKEGQEKRNTNTIEEDSFKDTISRDNAIETMQLAQNDESKKSTNLFSVKVLSIVAIILSATIILSPLGLIVGIIAIIRAKRLKRNNSIVSIRKIKGFLLSLISIILAAVILLSILLGFFIWYTNHTHQYGEWTTIKAATCTETGMRERECSICHFVETEQIEKVEHDWKSASCTEPRKCNLCGLTSGEALGHTWKPATCTEPKKCTTCGLTDGKPLGHDISDYKCNRCGLTFVEATDVPNIIDISNPKYHLNSVGGIDVYLTITNKYKKTIKYVNVEVEFYNAVGDVLQNQIGFGTSKKLIYTGPLEQGQTDSDVFWEACFYNTTFDGSMNIRSVSVEYTDGSKIDLEGENAHATVVNWR